MGRSVVPTASSAAARRNVARYLLARLNRGGRGTRVEIHPLNQSGVRPSHQRVVELRTLNIRHWEVPEITTAQAAYDARLH